nr:MAG TPA: hypothetical protein [Bacteriophage sp.]
MCIIKSIVYVHYAYYTIKPYNICAIFMHFVYCICAIYVLLYIQDKKYK